MMFALDALVCRLIGFFKLIGSNSSIDNDSYDGAVGFNTDCLLTSFLIHLFPIIAIKILFLRHVTGLHF